MTPIIFALALIQPPQDAMPEPWTLYHQAVACAVSAGIALESERPAVAAPGDGDLPEGVDEVLAWGMVMAWAGPQIGRTPEEIDQGDAARAEPFFREMLARRPEAFAAHRAYCRAFTP